MQWNPKITWFSSTAIISLLMAILLFWPGSEFSGLEISGSGIGTNLDPSNANGNSKSNGEGAAKPPDIMVNPGTITKTDGNAGGGTGGGNPPGLNQESPPLPPPGPDDKAIGEATDKSGKKSHFLTLTTGTNEVEKGESFDYQIRTRDEILPESLKPEVFINNEQKGAEFDVAVTGKGKDFRIRVTTKKGGKLDLEIREGTLLDTPSGKTYKLGKCIHYGKPVEVWEPITLKTKIDKMMVQPGEKVLYDMEFSPKPVAQEIDVGDFRNNQSTPVKFDGLKPGNSGWQMEARASEPGKIQLAFDKPFRGRSADGILLKSKGPWVDNKEVEVQTARLDIKGKMLLVIADTAFFRSNRNRIARLMTLAKGDFHPDPIFLLKSNGTLLPWDGTNPERDMPWAPEDLAKAWSAVPQALTRQTKTPEVGTFLLWPESSNQDTFSPVLKTTGSSERKLGLIGNPNRVPEELEKQLPAGNLLDLRTDWQALVGSIELQLVK